MLFADDFVGISDSKESLQKLIDGVYVTGSAKTCQDAGVLITKYSA